MLSKNQLIPLIWKGFNGGLKVEYMDYIRQLGATYTCPQSKQEYKITHAEFLVVKLTMEMIKFFTWQAELPLPTVIVVKIFSYVEKYGEMSFESTVDEILTQSYDVPTESEVIKKHNEHYKYKEFLLTTILEQISDLKVVKHNGILFASILCRLRSNHRIIDTPCRVAMLSNRDLINNDLYKLNFTPALKEFMRKPRILSLLERQAIYDRAENLKLEDVGNYNAIGTIHFRKVLSVEAESEENRPATAKKQSRISSSKALKITGKLSRKYKKLKA